MTACTQQLNVQSDSALHKHAYTYQVLLFFCYDAITKLPITIKTKADKSQNINIHRHVYTIQSLNTFKYHVSCSDGKISVRIYLPLFSTIVPFYSCMFLSCRSFVINTKFSTPTRPVENVVLTTKGLQNRNIQLLDETTMENKGKLILNAESVQTFS